MLGCILTLHSGGSWLGDVFFVISHPIQTHVFLSTRSYIDLEKFCKTHNLILDRDYLEIIFSKLEYDVENRWVVPQKYISKDSPVTSSNKYLKEIQKDLF